MAVAPPWLRDLAGAWVFYSLLPGWPGVNPGFERIARFAPWIGLVIGGLQAGLWLLLQAIGWSVVATVPVLIAFALWVTGGLHLDGVMDTADGLAAGVNRRLEAMEDSRVGASGVLALILVLLLQFSALVALAEHCTRWMPFVLLSAAFWGRCAPLWAVLRFPYLKADGTAGFHRSSAKGLREWTPALVVVVACLLGACWRGVGLPVLLIGAAGFCISGLVAERLGHRLGGHTGDSYGASVVWTETLLLVVLALLSPVWRGAAG